MRKPARSLARPVAPKAGTARDVAAALRALGTAEKAAVSARFFRTGPGEYGEGDVFLGVTVPEQRKVAARFEELPLGEVEKLLDSEVHEHRLVALLVWCRQFRAGDAVERARIVRSYLARARRVNNWDLVDGSAPYLLGEHLRDRPRKVLDRLAKSKNLWERRIAVLATHALIRAGEADDALRVCERLLDDEEDLLHKAVGWTLREVGKRVDEGILRRFLETHAPRMPRTALRYAIERFPPAERKRWLSVSRAHPRGRP